MPPKRQVLQDIDPIKPRRVSSAHRLASNSTARRAQQGLQRTQQDKPLAAKTVGSQSTPSTPLGQTRFGAPQQRLQPAGTQPTIAAAQHPQTPVARIGETVATVPGARVPTGQPTPRDDGRMGWRGVDPRTSREAAPRMVRQPGSVWQQTRPGPTRTATAADHMRSTFGERAAPGVGARPELATTTGQISIPPPSSIPDPGAQPATAPPPAGDYRTTSQALTGEEPAPEPTPFIENIDQEERRAELQAAGWSNDQIDAYMSLMAREGADVMVDTHTGRVARLVRDENGNVVDAEELGNLLEDPQALTGVAEGAYESSFDRAMAELRDMIENRRPVFDEAAQEELIAAQRARTASDQARAVQAMMERGARMGAAPDAMMAATAEAAQQRALADANQEAIIRLQSEVQNFQSEIQQYQQLLDTARIAVQKAMNEEESSEARAFEIEMMKRQQQAQEELVRLQNELANQISWKDVLGGGLGLIGSVGGMALGGYLGGLGGGAAGAAGRPRP